jgi:poly(beta-D-mannuronate) lyase
VYSLLDAAAVAEAWTDKMPDYSGVYIQDWELSGVGMAYLKVRESGVGAAQQEAHIQRWFGLLAGRVREYFDPLIAQNVWINNHVYWAGLAVAAEGIAGNDRGAFEWGMRAYSIGVGLIQPDGTLKAEMDRGQMALHYHLYALGPLIMLAELGEANGETMYAYDHGAIHRLVAFCVAGLDDPGIVEKRTGKAQVVPQPLAGLDVGWGVPYVRRFPNAALSALIAKAAWTRFWQWGGTPPA